MSAARLRSVKDAEFAEIGEQRRGERRSQDRRSPKWRLDPLFAATLVNQVAPGSNPAPRAYDAPLRLRAGIAFDLVA